QGTVRGAGPGPPARHRAREDRGGLGPFPGPPPRPQGFGRRGRPGTRDPEADPRRVLPALDRICPPACPGPRPPPPPPAGPTLSPASPAPTPPSSPKPSPAPS